MAEGLELRESLWLFGEMGERRPGEGTRLWAECLGRGLEVCRDRHLELAQAGDQLGEGVSGQLKLQLSKGRGDGSQGLAWAWRGRDEALFRCARPSGVPRGPATSTGSLASQRHPGIPSAQRLVWAAKQPLGKAALGALFA